MIKGIEHIAICAKDTKALAHWYVDVFGWKIVDDNGKGNYFLKAADGSMVEVMQSNGEDFTSSLFEGGIRHIALSIGAYSFDTMVAKLKGVGVEVVTDVTVAESGVKTFFFKDIEGNIFHLIYRPVAL